MKAIRLLLILLLIIMGSHVLVTVAATKENKSVNQMNDENRFYYGGYLNLTFGTYTAIGVSPLIAYKINPRLSAGTTLTYEYVSDNSYPGYTYKASNYGASIFSRYRIIPQIYLHAEFSEMNYDLYNAYGANNRYWVPFLFLGGGFSQPISPNTWVNTQVLFDVIQDDNSPYSKGAPFFSIGFGVGF